MKQADKSRRRALRTIGTFLTGSIAGCSKPSEILGEKTETKTKTETETATATETLTEEIETEINWQEITETVQVKPEIKQKQKTKTPLKITAKNPNGLKNTKIQIQNNSHITSNNQKHTLYKQTYQNPQQNQETQIPKAALGPHENTLTIKTTDKNGNQYTDTTTIQGQGTEFRLSFVDETGAIGGDSTYNPEARFFDQVINTRKEGSYEQWNNSEKVEKRPGRKKGVDPNKKWIEDKTWQGMYWDDTHFFDKVDKIQPALKNPKQTNDRTELIKDLIINTGNAFEQKTNLDASGGRFRTSLRRY
jgi:hypothetical protein